MNNGISSTILHYWSSGRKTRTTPSGWISGNSVCCAHNGERADVRGRGGLTQTTEGGVVYSCFNCGFKASWMPGRPLSKKIKKLMQWMGVPDDTISKLALGALKTQTQMLHDQQAFIPQFSKTLLPNGSIPIDFNSTPSDSDLLTAMDYAMSRKLDQAGITLYWSPELAYRKRIIFPFTWQGEIVGWSCRATDDIKKPKYIRNSQPGYVYNVDAQDPDRKLCIVCEGIVDAALIGACAVLSNEIGKQQAQVLNNLGKQIIVLPDRDHSGKKMVDAALEHGWSVSFPPWDTGIKDAADAVLKYGTLYTLYSIVQHAQHTNLKIQLAAKTWFNK